MYWTSLVRLLLRQMLIFSVLEGNILKLDTVLTSVILKFNYLPCTQRVTLCYQLSSIDCFSKVSTPPIQKVKGKEDVVKRYKGFYWIVDRDRSLSVGRARGDW